MAKMAKKVWQSHRDLSFFRWFPGLPFFLTGLFAVFSPVVYPIPMAGSGEPTPPLVIVPFGLLCAAAGAAIFGWRQVTAVDPIQGTVRKWWGIFVPWRTWVYQIKDFDKITIRREVRGHRESKVRVFPVSLEGRERVILELETDPQSARRSAKEIARLLSLDIHDHCGKDVAVREFASLGKPLKQRLDIDEKTKDLKAPPHWSACTVHSEGNSAHIHIPCVGIGMQIMIPAGALLFILIVAWMIFRPGPPEPDDPPGWQEIMTWISRGIMGLLAVIGSRFLIIPALQDGFRSEHLDISPGRILYTRRFIFSASEEIAIKDVDEIVVEQQGVKGLHQLSSDIYRMSIRSDADELIVAAGHPKEELDWLAATLKYLMSQMKA